MRSKNILTDKYAKQALKSDTIFIETTLVRSETNALIQKGIKQLQTNNCKNSGVIKIKMGNVVVECRCTI